MMKRIGTRTRSLLACALPAVNAHAIALHSTAAGRTIGARSISAGVISPGMASVQSTPDPMQLRRDILANPDLQQREAPVTPPPLPDVPDVDLSFLRYILAGLGAVVLVVLLAVLIPILVRYFVKAASRRAAGDDLAHDAEVSTSAEAVQRAQQASFGQDYRLALRMLYLAALLKLDEVGALRYDRALTNREYVRQVVLQPALASALSPVVEIFDDAWYGYKPVTADGYAAFESRVTALMAVAEANRSG